MNKTIITITETPTHLIIEGLGIARDKQATIEKSAPQFDTKLSDAITNLIERPKRVFTEPVPAEQKAKQ